PGYKLPGSTPVADRLRTELQQVEAVLGILTPSTKESSYVLFELGASWVRGIVTFPLLAAGADPMDAPDAIKGLPSLALSNDTDCYQLLDNLANFTTLKRKQNSGAATAVRIRALVGAASPS